MEWKLIKAHYCKGRTTPPIDSDIGPISTLELSKLCKNKKIIEIQRKKLVTVSGTPSRDHVSRGKEWEGVSVSEGRPSV